MKTLSWLFERGDNDSNGGINIKNFCIDSREVTAGDVFFAFPGVVADGRDFVSQALEKGASAIVYDPVGLAGVPWQADVPLIPLENLSSRLGDIASEFYGKPSKSLAMVGVTGTNGKTTCCHLLAGALTTLANKTAVLGTVGNGVWGQLQQSGLTTVDAVSLQKQLAEFVKQDVRAVAMEVSSHGLEQGRVNGVDFQVAVFTNLSRDHLDYHKTMEAYAAAKLKLFQRPGVQYAVVNAQDVYSQTFVDAATAPVTVFAVNQVPEAFTAYPAVIARDVQLDEKGISAEILSPWGEGKLCSKLLGEFNLQNLLAVITSLGVMGFALKDILESITEQTGAPGRMQCFNKQGVLAVVDYAHTPDALRCALIALRQHCRGQLICVFGCGGDRDQGKRPEMAMVAEQCADHIVVTNDNPRSEDPQQIAADILAGFDQCIAVQVELDRGKAIDLALSQASKGDVVLVAGKGHEDYQLVGEQRLSFSDIEWLSEA